MKSLRELCQVRETVFDRSKRDTVLDLTDLWSNTINPDEFFTENYLTEGMKTLLRESFRRFQGISTQGVFILSQAMGGGKTHNMICLGLLAKYPHLRSGVDVDIPFESDVRVLGFTGRETDAPLGIWGAIASQLGKKELFKDYYSPLQAPGQTAWINLLKSEQPTLILLDELPPYFENAKSITIGDSNLSRVTTTALSNLLVAVNKEELANVCVVISDLKATYEGGSDSLNKALDDLKNEANRTAISLEPVGYNNDDIYHILRKRLFSQLPDEAEIQEVALAYAKAVKDAKQMDITNASPEKFAAQIKQSYPFHFAIRDLYARFRENPGFQQTRGLIRLMRAVIASLYQPNGKADQISLIHAHDIDLNDSETRSQIDQINPTLANAISHDIAANGEAISEILDSNLGGNSAQDVCKLIFMASLANIPNAILGLSLSEIISSLCMPGRDVSHLKQEILPTLATKAWYLHTNTEGQLFFKNTENLVARLKSTADAYNRQSSLKELQTFLINSFNPSLKDCYQEVMALPSVDEINIKADKVTLIIYEPFAGGVHPDLAQRFTDLDYKNRILFLSGARGSLDSLLDTSAELKAISHILAEMRAIKIAQNDPQFTSAQDMEEKIRFRLLSAVRETFTVLYYPVNNELRNADFIMTFTDNNYNGEAQIRDTLKSKGKFTEDIASDSFRKKCEQRLFTQKVMLWTEIKKRAAIDTRWQWHRMDALDTLRTDLILKQQWREDGGYIEKPPFPKPDTEVRCRQVKRNGDTGEVTLSLTPVHGDTIYYEIGATATTASQKIEDFNSFVTSELEISFLCVDSQGEHETGEAMIWKNSITLKQRIYQQGENKMMELKSAPPTPIRYTTDGSNPKDNGGSYDEPFVIPLNTVCVLAVAEKQGIVSEVLRVDIAWDKKDDFTINPNVPVVWKREHRPTTTKESYEFLARLKKYQVIASGVKVFISGTNWLELAIDENLTLDGDKIEEAVNYLRSLLSDGEVEIDAPQLHFPTGQLLLDWVAEVRTQIHSYEVEQ